MKYFIICILSLFFSKAVYGEVCLSLEREWIELNDIGNRFKISPKGSHLFYYMEEKNSLILFDLDTKEKTEFISFKKNLSDVDLFLNDFYGFSQDDSLAWSKASNPFIKAKNFATGEIKSFSSVPEGALAIATHYDFLEKKSKLFTLYAEENYVEKIEKLEEAAQKEKWSRKETLKRLKEILQTIKGGISVLNLKNFSQRIDIPVKMHDIIFTCSILSSNLLLQVRNNGSLYGKNLDLKSPFFEIFGPIEGIKEVYAPNANFLDSDFIPNCFFLDENKVLIKNFENGNVILRRIKEREEFIIPEEFVKGDHIEKRIYYPFIRIDLGAVYHIPSAQVHYLNENHMQYYEYYEHVASNIAQVHYLNENHRTQYKHLRLMGKAGQSIIQVLFEPAPHYRVKKIQFVHHPFDEEKKRILFEWDPHDINYMSHNSDVSLFFIGTVFGDLFILDVQTGHIKKHFFGQWPSSFSISDSGNNFVFKYLENGRASYKIHRIQEKCVQPESGLSTTLEQSFQEFANFEDPGEEDFLSFLTGVLEEEENIKKYSYQIQAVLWKILLSKPHLYLDLYFHYPELKSLPPFSPDLIKKEKVKAQVRKALLSLFEIQTHFRHTWLFYWDFIHILKPILQVLTKEEKDFYIEKITESLSNGATQNVKVFQDVFQSKLFYVIYSHVKSWFGRDYEPVSDITVLRKRQSFQTLILSSEPIKNHPSKKTGFGIHYAFVEKLSREMFIGEVKGGQELVRDSVEWNVLNGKSYRAYLQVNVQDMEDKSYLKKDKSPHYESVWKDEKMTGLIIIGSSLRSFSKPLLKNYLSYFKDQGFKFSPLPVSDFQPFFKEKIGNCELDYFLKESHSDGDERNVFRFDRFNDVMRGVRQAEKGQTEIIYLAFPKPFHFKKPETLLFSNLELAELIRQRERKGCGEITYFNTSCWAHVKARYEIEAAHSPLFLNIPSKSLSNTFLNEEGTAIRALIDSYRNNLDFDGFRKALEKNAGYKSGRLNQYIFPDESEYYQSIFESISIPLKIHIDLQIKENGKWKSIQPDEAL